MQKFLTTIVLSCLYVTALATNNTDDYSLANSSAAKAWTDNSVVFGTKDDTLNLTAPQTSKKKWPVNFQATRSISGNPAAVDIEVGTGKLQSYLEQLLNIHNDHGIYLGGAFMGDTNVLLSGGIPNPQQWTENGLLLLGLAIDTDKLMGLKGGTFAVQFLQFNGQDTNSQAGSVQGYNSLPGSPPLNRSELYQLWYRQALFNNKLIIRVGKTVPTFDFDNVIKPIPIDSSYQSIQAVSSLLYTPAFVNPSMLGAMPGYYNSAYGVTASYAPIKQWYITYGIYDSDLAAGEQTGLLAGPSFNGSYFDIGETGATWLLGGNELPGNIGVGGWHQSGLVQGTPDLSQNGASGYYAFADQRLWYQDPFEDSNGLTSFMQYGKNESDVLPMTQYIGAGLTAFGLIPHRECDSMGAGLAYSWLNPAIFIRHNELMYQWYYQAQVIKDIFYIEPAITYIPMPGATPEATAAWAGTLRAILLF